MYWSLGTADWLVGRSAPPLGCGGGFRVVTVPRVGTLYVQTAVVGQLTAIGTCGVERALYNGGADCMEWCTYPESTDTAAYISDTL